MVINLRCHNVVVTGGGSGIGLAIAKKLLDNGCRVCITGRNLEKLQNVAKEINSDNLSVLQFDVTNIESIVPKLNEAACLLGGYYDAVVNSAGVHSPVDNWNISEEVWDKIMDIDLKSAIFLTRKAVICMRDNNIHGNILHISSVAGNHGYGANGAYELAKDSLINATRFMGKQAAHLDIVINGIAPGLTYTAMTPRREVPHDLAAIARIIEPEEIADIAMFMLSQEAKICIGETILADGGYWRAW